MSKKINITNKIFRIYHPLLLLILMLTSSCKEEEETIIPTFYFTHRAINEGSKSISRLNVYASTFYPNEKQFEAFGTGKNIFHQPNDEDFLNPYDSIVVSPSLKVYPGCIVMLKVSVAHIVQNPDSGLDQETMIVYTLEDTVKDISDNHLEIVWPRDSIFFKPRN